jgi:hypothetical protein
MTDTSRCKYCGVFNDLHHGQVVLRCLQKQVDDLKEQNKDLVAGSEDGPRLKALIDHRNKWHIAHNKSNTQYAVFSTDMVNISGWFDTYREAIDKAIKMDS